jgi:hypothetical protein
VSAFALLIHRKPPRKIAESKEIDTDDCSREFWTRCNKMNLKSLEERKAEHVEVLFIRYTGLKRTQKSQKLSRDDFGGILSYFIGVATDSGEKFIDTYDFYGLQSSLNETVNNSHAASLNAYKGELEEEIRNNRVLRHRRIIRNADSAGIVAVVFLAILFFLGADEQIVFLRSLVVLLAFGMSVVLLLLSLWVCLEIDRINGTEV